MSLIDFRMSFSSPFAASPGLRTLGSPHSPQGSLNQFELPKHQPPGETIPRPRLRMCASIMSNKGESAEMLPTNATSLLSILSEFEALKIEGSRAVLSELTNRKLELMTASEDSLVLHARV